MKLILRHKNYCDICAHLQALNTLGQHKRCKIYKKNMLPQEDIFLSNKGLGYFPRPKFCQDENEAVIRK